MQPEETSTKQQPTEIPVEVLQSKDVSNLIANQATPSVVPKGIEPSGREKEETERTSDGIRGFCEFTHEYIRGYIDFADQKAAFLFAFVSAITAYLLTSKHSPFVTAFVWVWPPDWLLLSGKISVLLYALSALLCVYVVWPRLGRSAAPGLIFWEEIVVHGSAEEYAAKACSQKDEAASCEIAKHSFMLATVCKQKYKWVSIAMILMVIATLLLGVYMWPKLPLLALVDAAGRQ